MTAPTARGRRRNGNRARASALMHAARATIGALAIAIGGIPPAANAQQMAQQLAQQIAPQSDSATPPAPSTATRPDPPKGTTSVFDVNVGASITSDYNYRGYTLSDHRASTSTNIEATYNIF